MCAVHAITTHGVAELRAPAILSAYSVFVKRSTHFKKQGAKQAKRMSPEKNTGE
jgi:hypothetical protein